MRASQEHFFEIHQGEFRKVLLLFLYAFGTAAAYVVSRSVADGIFLSRVGPQYLPLMYVLAAVVVVAASMLYSRLAKWWRLESILRVWLLGLAGSALVLPSLLERFDHSLLLLASLYILAELRGGLGTITFGTMMNEMFARGDGRRVYGFIGVGATLAGVLFGALVGYEATQFGVTNLLYLVAGLEIATLLPVQWLRGEFQASRRRALTESQASRQSTLLQVAALPYIRMIAALVFLKVLVNFLVEYQWKVAATGAFAGSADSEAVLTSFFGSFYCAVYLLTGLLQLFVTGPLLRRLDLMVALSVFPGSLIGALTAVWATAASGGLLVMLTAAKGCEVFKRSVQDPAMQVLFAPLEKTQRRQGIAFVNGMVKPSAEALAGLMLWQFVISLPEQGLVMTTLLLAGLWLAMAWICRNHHAQLIQPEPNQDDEPTLEPPQQAGANLPGWSKSA